MNHDFRKFHFRSILFDEISRSPGSEPLMRLPNDSLQIICSLEWLSEVKNDIMNADWSKLKSNGNKNVIGKTNVEFLLLILIPKKPFQIDACQMKLLANQIAAPRKSANQSSKLSSKHQFVNLPKVSHLVRDKQFHCYQGPSIFLQVGQQKNLEC